MSQTRIPIEVCLDSADSAVAAEQGGAQRVELCDNLVEGGTTPSAGMIAATLRATSIGVHVMIRPRGGDFCYSALEVEVMKEDIRVAKELGAHGVVFGMLTPEGSLDEALTRELLDAARPMSVTVHRAFDMCTEPRVALDLLIELGVDRVLTSGQESSALEGLDLITELVWRAKDRIIVMPGCGITPRNIQRIAETSRARELHVVANEAVLSPMQYRNARCFMGTAITTPEYERQMTSANGLRGMLSALES